MSLKSLIVPRVAERILSEITLNAKRRKFETARRKNGRPHRVEFFHDPTDPYSQLLQQVLPEFSNRYDIELSTHIVSPPGDGAAPEREKLSAYALRDAALLARKAGLSFTYQNHPPFKDTQTADKRLETLGHYLGGTLYYGGEWYWGLDRLHYLETRLFELGASRTSSAPSLIFSPPSVPTGTGETGADLHWYLSFRSPYSAISVGRVKALADTYGAELKFRFVLPMVMRGLPVPPAKKAYIPLDTAREARRLGIPFGRVCDPVGTPVERGYSLLPWARSQGRGFEYVSAFLQMVWSEGVDAGTDRGLKKIVERAELNWADAKPHVGNENWRAEAEVNRAEMMEFGTWGVPSFRVGDTITWGQDRLWVIEDTLKNMGKNR